MFLFFCFFPAFAVSDLKVEFSNILEAKGDLYVAVYNSSNAFLKEDQVFRKIIVPITQTGALKVSIDDLPPGQYALSCFHDVNGNGKLNTNWMGIPNEPYGFSNNARPKFRAPNWGEASFDFKEMGGSMKIRLEKW